jgi:hypothetical protein
MQLEGAWMIKTPMLRMLSSTWFIRGTISSSRRTALRQWCESHMSQTMIAVWPGCHVSLPSFKKKDHKFHVRVMEAVFLEKTNATGHGEHYEILVPETELEEVQDTLSEMLH